LNRVFFAKLAFLGCINDCRFSLVRPLIPVGLALSAWPKWTYEGKTVGQPKDFLRHVLEGTISDSAAMINIALRGVSASFLPAVTDF
jgi:hypothetical protein